MSLVMDYKSICDDVVALARTTGLALLEYRSKNELVIETKGHNDFVTQMDKFSEKLLVEGLSRIVPQAGFIVEESTRTDRGDVYNWVVDPIDGTTNFIKDFEHSAISVGLAKDKELVLGVVMDPDLNNIYYAEKGKGAFLNGKPIHVSDNNIENSLVLFGTCPYEHEFAHETFVLTEEIFYKAIEVRRSGTAALDICYVASGKSDLYYELILRPWDWAGATVILKEAGGVVSRVDGTNVDANTIDSYVCGNKNNIKEFYEIYNAKHIS